MLKRLLFFLCMFFLISACAQYKNDKPGCSTCAQDACGCKLHAGKGKKGCIGASAVTRSRSVDLNIGSKPPLRLHEIESE